MIIETSQFRPDSRLDTSPMLYIADPLSLDNNIVITREDRQLRETPLAEFLQQDVHPSDRRAFIEEFPGEEGFYGRHNLQLLANALGRPIRMFFDCDEGKVDFWSLPIELMINDEFFYDSTRVEKRLGGLFRIKVTSHDVVVVALPVIDRLSALGLNYSR